MVTDLATQNGAARAIEQVLVGGDLSKLNVEQRVTYYRSVCNSLGLNELTRPFDYLHLNGKLILYARKDATDQLRSRRGVTIALDPAQVGDLYVVTARATLPDGRSDEEIGAVAVAGLKGDALANAMMKATTKAKRRVTLSICGLGMLDETEVETIPDARRFEEPSPTPALTDARPAYVAKVASRELPDEEPPQSRQQTEPAVSTGEDIPEDQAEEVAALFDEPKERDSQLRGECRSLWLRMQGMLAFKAVKLPLDTAPEAEWSQFLDVWREKVAEADRSNARRAAAAKGPGR